MLEPIEPGSTKIGLDECSEPEQQLFNEAYKIIDSFKANPRDLEPWQHDILTRATDRLQHRILDIGFYGLLRLFEEDDSEIKSMWAVRFWYFMFEWLRWIKRHRKEKEIMARTKGWKQFDKEWDKWWVTLSDEEKIPLWTSESFTYWFNKYVIVSYEEYLKRRKERKKKGKVTA
jgi:hypothetical protein